MKNILSLVLCFILTISKTIILYAQDIPEHSRYTLAVLDLEAYGVSQVEAQAISNSLRAHITRHVASDEFRNAIDIDYTILERSQMDRIFEQFEIQNTECTDIACAIEFGKILSAQRIIIGSVGLVGETYTITTSIVDVETSQVLNSADYQFRGEIDNLLEQGVTEVTEDLFGIKKSFAKYYLIGGAILIGTIVAILSINNDGDKDSTSGNIVIKIPDPSE